MTVPNFATYTTPANTEGDTYRPRDNYNHPCIVMVNEYKENVVTPNSPNGAPAVVVDLVDLHEGKTYRDVLLMTGALVDGFRAHAGTRVPLVVWWSKTMSKAGRDYATAQPGTPEHIAAATQYYATHGDPFAPKFAAPTVTEQAPF